MTGACACCTIFFHASRDTLASLYETSDGQVGGYLVRLGEQWLLVDAVATETADWARQVELATAMSVDNVVALSLFFVGNQWALALAFNGERGPVAVHVPGEAKLFEQLPYKLLALERALVDVFPMQVDAEQVDALFGAVLEGVMPINEAVGEILDMLGCPPDWVRWSWYETIAEQLFIDPDLEERVLPLGETGKFWES